MRKIWHRIKSQPLFSAVYVLGTAASVAAVMIVAVFLHTQLSPIYPELHRGDIYRITFAESLEPDGNQTESGGLSYSLCMTITDRVNDYADVSLTRTFWPWDEQQVNSADDLDATPFEVSLRATDPNFFRIYDYEFEQGKPFGEDDDKKAVLTTDLARKLFADASDVVGRTFLYNGVEYTVGGVVRGGSGLLQGSYGELFVPYWSIGNGDDWRTDGCCVGMFRANIRVHTPDGGARLNEDLKDIIRRHDAEFKGDHRLHITHLAESAFTTLSRRSVFEEGGAEAFIRKFGLVFLILLLVPALNLSGLIASTMESRMAEMGVRKAFGARRGTLLRQIIYENVFLSTIGGLIGLAASWWAITAWKDWVFNSLIGNSYSQFENITIGNDMLFSPRVFIIAFLTCMVLNVASSLIPAWRALNRPIVSSMNQ